METRYREKRQPKTEVAPAQRLFFDGIESLTLHGGIDASGRLVVIPVFPALGIKGLKPKDYQLESQRLWAEPIFLNAVASFGLGQMTGVEAIRFRHPALNFAAPLPGASVINRFLGPESPTPSRNSLAKTQVGNAGLRPKWSLFTSPGFVLQGGYSALAQRCLALDGQTPGIVGELFRPILEAIVRFKQALEKAESDRQLLILSSLEHDLALKYVQITSGLGWGGSGASTSWGSYLASIAEGESLLLSDVVQSHAESPPLSGDVAPSFFRVPDAGYGECLRFIQKVNQASSEATLRPAGNGNTPQTRGAFYSDNATIRAKASQRRYAEALGLLWTMTLDFAGGRPPYTENVSTDEDFAAFRRRYDRQGAFALLKGTLASRPLAEGGAIIVRHEGNSHREGKTSSEVLTEPQITIEPAVLRPHVAAVREVSRAKKFPSIKERFFSWETWRFEKEENGTTLSSSLYADPDREFVWPQGRLWITIDLIKTMLAVPDLFLCPELLAKGSVRIPASVWDARGLKPGEAARAKGREEPDDAASAPTWSHVNESLTGAFPWSNVPIPPGRRHRYGEQYDSSWPLSVIEAGFQASDVRLGVRYEPCGGSAREALLQSLLQALPALARAARCAAEPGLTKALLAIGGEMRFVARPYFEVEGMIIEEADWFKAQKTGGGYYRLPDGSALATSIYESKTDQFILRNRVYAKFKTLGLSDLWRVHQEALSASSSRLPPEEYLRQLALRVSPLWEGLDLAAAPLGEAFLNGPLSELRETLRSYQTQGIVWTYVRLKVGLGVCLADEMGLGKTLQAIALIRLLREQTGAALIVVPKTLLGNWRNELLRFGGGLSVETYDPSRAPSGADVCLVTYPRLRLDKAYFAQKQWGTVVLDEAQAIKNSGSQIAEAASQLKALYRLALTGTPVENRAAELWSVIEWLNPGYLGREADFAAYTKIARSAEQKALLLAPLKECLTPIILRRRKNDPSVALGLPDKIHQNHLCELSEEQTALYEAVLEAVLAEERLALGAFKKRALFLKAILHLKQICIHPDLFYGDQDDETVLHTVLEDARAGMRGMRSMRKAVRERLSERRRKESAVPVTSRLERSGKLSLLKSLLDDLRGQSRGILLFTQYLGAAEMVRRLIETMGEAPGDDGAVPFLHGGLCASDRQGMVEDFNAECLAHADGAPCPILILSLKAGGTGLNLIGADRVIHIDRWWNPAVEDQATDRAHRIGQNRTVFVHTITSENTIEAAIARLFAEKRALAEDLLGAAASSGVGEWLESRSGFLGLADPAGIFTRQLAGVGLKAAGTTQAHSQGRLA